MASEDWDAKAEAEGKAEAAKFGPKLLDDPEVVEELKGLLLTYSDAQATDALDDLRSWFWGEALPAAVKKGAA